MTTVFSALLPVFMLILAGAALRRILIREDAHWIGIERVVYYVLFPALLIDTLARTDLGGVPLAGMGGALATAVLLMAEILTVQTAAAIVTMPVAITFAANLRV